MPTTSELPALPGAEAIPSAQPPDSRSDEPGSLDWDGFRARWFPGRRPRHDFQAVEAYGIYKRTIASDVGQALAFEENASTPTERQHGEIVQTEERLVQTETIMDGLVSLGLYAAVANPTGESKRYREAPRLVETTSRLSSQARARELNDVLDAWDEDSENDKDTERFADEAGQ
jgi:hypothetical protein